MRSYISFFLSLTALIIVSAFANTAARKQVTLEKAVKDKLVAVELISNGNYEGASVEVKLTNLSASNYEISIPSGTTYLPENEDEQCLIQIEDEVLVLNKNENKTNLMNAYCTESSDKCPGLSNHFSLASSSNEKLTKLTQYFQAKKVDERHYQDAIWTVTDGHSISNITGTDTTSLKLRTFLSELTGQKNPWYTSPQDIQVSETGNIISKTTEIEGEIAFKCAAGSVISEDICRADGSVIFSSENKMRAPYGNVQYEFKMKTTGWPEGDYYILIHQEENEFARFEFSI